MKKHKKWLFVTLLLCVCIMTICIVVTYIVDPFFQYRVRDNEYMINCEYAAPGLIKNYDYDTLMIGSSMTQNFDMDKFADEMNCKPLHIAIAGMTEEDMTEYLQLAVRTCKAKTYYLCIDMPYFAYDGESRIVPYLMKDDILSKLRYAFSFENIMRYTPVDIALKAYAMTGRELPESYKYRMGVDRFGYTGHQYEYGKEYVLEGYELGNEEVAEIETEDLYSRMIGKVDAFLERVSKCGDSCVFFFPPYSALYWWEARRDGYYNTYLDVKQYMIRKMNAFGAKVYDFQVAREVIGELDNYRDVSHYSPVVNDWMTECFATGEYRLTDEDIESYREQLDAIVDDFEMKMEDL